MTSPLLNYIFRSVFIIVGLLILTGVLEVAPYDNAEANQNVRIAGGLILVLFGIYRIALYRIKSKRFDFAAENDEYEDDENEELTK